MNMDEETKELVTEIIKLVLHKNAKDKELFVQYYGNANLLEVYYYSLGYERMDEKDSKMITHRVYLDRPETKKKLEAVIEDINDL